MAMYMGRLAADMTEQATALTTKMYWPLPPSTHRKVMSMTTSGACRLPSLSIRKRPRAALLPVAVMTPPRMAPEVMYRKGVLKPEPAPSEKVVTKAVRTPLVENRARKMVAAMMQRICWQPLKIRKMYSARARTMPMAETLTLDNISECLLFFLRHRLCTGGA